MSDQLALLFEYGSWRVVSVDQHGNTSIVHYAESLDEAMQSIATAYGGRVIFEINARPAP